MAESITVHGTGRVEARPDIAVLDLGTEGRAESVDNALGVASRALNAMTGALREQGVAVADLRTEGPSTYTVTDEVGRVNSYVCSFRLTARIADPDRAGALVAACVAQAGDAGRVHGVNYTLSDRAGHQRQARALAVADARSRAVQLADLVDRTLGRATSVVEAGTGGPIRPMAKAMAMSMDSAAELEPGVEQVSVGVEVTWVFAD